MSDTTMGVVWPIARSPRNVMRLAVWLALTAVAFLVLETLQRRIPWEHFSYVERGFVLVWAIAPLIAVRKVLRYADGPTVPDDARQMLITAALYMAAFAYVPALIVFF